MKILAEIIGSEIASSELDLSSISGGDYLISASLNTPIVDRFGQLSQIEVAVPGLVDVNVNP